MPGLASMTITLPMLRRKLQGALRAVDDRLCTRPLFTVVFATSGLPWRERGAVAYHVLRTVADYWGRRAGWAVRETASAAWLRHIRRGKVATGGMRRVQGLEEWWQATTPAAIHRCRIALGRLRGRVGRGSVVLFCGYRLQSGDHPVYVLLDRSGRVADMAFDAGEGRLTPGIGRLSGSRPRNRPALEALSAHLAAGEPNQASIGQFFPEAEIQFTAS